MANEEGAPGDLSALWDVAVVGTGMGGATVGHALARQGFSVLFLEKGGSISPDAWTFEATDPSRRLFGGWWPQPISQRLDNGRRERFYAAIGCGLGGSSVLYAGALERMPPQDFEALDTARQSIPAWPGGYEAFEASYAAAEALFGLPPVDDDRGEVRLSEWDRALMATMRGHGLRPERLRVAMRYDDACLECMGRACPRRCKAEARSVCLDDAVSLPRCRVLQNCDVQRLEADATRVQTIQALHGGLQIELRAKVVVLAAGGLHSPQVLLRSSNAHWPNGLANKSDQVGRNLMFHTSDMLAVWAPRRIDRQTRQKKSISVRDFYRSNGRRIGYLQSMGIEAGPGHVAIAMKNMLRRNGVRNEFLLSLLVKIPAQLGALALGNASLFAAACEDDPNPENRVMLDPSEPDGASFAYTITDELRERADELYAAFKAHVRPWHVVRLSTRLEMNHGHPCGTCRFGDDPSSNVLNRNCRAHDVENLYVVDSSFMPRSGAVNPSLTIAANALRVAPRIAEQLRTAR